MHRDSVVKYGWHDGERDSTNASLIANHKPIIYGSVRPERQHRTAQSKPVNKVSQAKRKMAQVQPVHLLGVTATTLKEADELRRLARRFFYGQDVDKTR